VIAILILFLFLFARPSLENSDKRAEGYSISPFILEEIGKAISGDKDKLPLEGQELTDSVAQGEKHDEGSSDHSADPESGLDLESPVLAMTVEPERETRNRSTPTNRPYLEPDVPFSQQVGESEPSLHETYHMWFPVIVSSGEVSDSPEALLPDLQTLTPYDLRLVIDSQRQRRFIRFSNAILNAGEGDLVMKGQLDRATNRVEVNQEIQFEDGSTTSVPMGEFHFHAPHNHYHWDGLAVYEVWSIHTDGSLDEILYSSDKVGYCIRDSDRILSDDEIPTSPVYLRCGPELQGISVGWADVYLHNTPGQFVDITGLPEGVYALKSTADPAGRLVEMDNENNSAVVYFELFSNRVQVIDPP
jgi:hypothetical protein